MAIVRRVFLVAVAGVLLSACGLLSSDEVSPIEANASLFLAQLSDGSASLEQWFDPACVDPKTADSEVLTPTYAELDDMLALEAGTFGSQPVLRYLDENEILALRLLQPLLTVGLYEATVDDADETTTTIKIQTTDAAPYDESSTIDVDWEQESDGSWVVARCGLPADFAS